LLKDGDVGIGVLPGIEEILLGGTGLDVVSGEPISPAELETGERAWEYVTMAAGCDRGCGKPSLSRTYARELVNRKDKIGSKERTQASDSTEASLRQKRRERLKTVSDEALIDLDDFTLMLIAKRG